jgi:predicted nucleotidyltransferase
MVTNKISPKALLLEAKGKKVNWSLKEKILKYLIENKSSQSSIKKISTNLKTDYKNTFQAINNISPDIIFKDKFGNTNLIEIKPMPKQAIYSIEDKRTKEFLQKNKKIQLIQNDIKNINYPFLIVLIFGSVVKKTCTIKSDIDICIISDNKLKIKQLISQLNLLPMNLEIHDFTLSEFESMLKTKEPNISKEIVKNNLILYGIENYYNLISKWTKKE